MAAKKAMDEAIAGITRETVIGQVKEMIPTMKDAKCAYDGVMGTLPTKNVKAMVAKDVSVKLTQVKAKGANLVSWCVRGLTNVQDMLKAETTNPHAPIRGAARDLENLSCFSSDADFRSFHTISDKKVVRDYTPRFHNKKSRTRSPKKSEKDLATEPMNPDIESYDDSFQIYDDQEETCEAPDLRKEKSVK